MADDDDDDDIGVTLTRIDLTARLTPYHAHTGEPAHLLWLLKPLSQHTHTHIHTAAVC